MSTHLSATLPSPSHPLIIQRRPIPTPGPSELLIAIKAIALNPADALIRTHGLLIPPSGYPTIIGFDFSGLVLEVGCDVPNNRSSPNNSQDGGVWFEPGMRVAAYAASFWRDWKADYGAFQERVLVPWKHAVLLPESVGWVQAATLPVSVQVPLCAWDGMGIPRLASLGGGEETGNGEKGEKREALLIWGASSSVGTMGVQSARLLKEDEGNGIVTVYATAGERNKEYVRELGADRVFDYKDPGVVDRIVEAAREDGVVIRKCFLATGQLRNCQDVLKHFVGDNGDGRKPNAIIASAPIVPADAETVAGVDVVFLQPATSEEERSEQFGYYMGTWLRQNLAKGTIRPSPEPKVVGKDLSAINGALDLLLQGVSCTKLVVEIEK